MTFDFTTAYDFFAKKLGGEVAPEDPYGPLLGLLTLKDGKVLVKKIVATELALIYFLLPTGREQLEKQITTWLQAIGEDDFIALIHEGHVKLQNDDFPAEHIEGIKQMGLMHDPTATHCIHISIYHKTGTRMGFMPLAEDRKVTYAALIDEDPVVHHVHLGADQLPKDLPTDRH